MIPMLLFIQRASEIPNDGIDQDYDGADFIQLLDNDGDGFVEEDDCDDDDSSIYLEHQRLKMTVLIKTAMVLIWWCL